MEIQIHQVVKLLKVTLEELAYLVSHQLETIKLCHSLYKEVNNLKEGYLEGNCNLAQFLIIHQYKLEGFLDNQLNNKLNHNH